MILQEVMREWDADGSGMVGPLLRLTDHRPLPLS